MKNKIKIYLVFYNVVIKRHLKSWWVKIGLSFFLTDWTHLSDPKDILPTDQSWSAICIITASQSVHVKWTEPFLPELKTISTESFCDVWFKGYDTYFEYSSSL